MPKATQPSPCIVCLGTNANEILNSFIAGQDAEDIAAQFRLTADDVIRHVAHTVQSDSVDPFTDSTPDTLLNALRIVAARLDKTIVDGFREGDTTKIMRGASEFAKNILAQHEIANRTPTDGPDTEIALARSTARKLFSAMHDSPEARKLISDALKGLSADLPESHDDDD